MCNSEFKVDKPRLLTDFEIDVRMQDAVDDLLKTTQANKLIVIDGDLGTGKSTLMNVLTEYMVSEMGYVTDGLLEDLGQGTLPSSSMVQRLVAGMSPFTLKERLGNGARCAQSVFVLDDAHLLPKDLLKRIWGSLPLGGVLVLSTKRLELLPKSLVAGADVLIHIDVKRKSEIVDILAEACDNNNVRYSNKVIKEIVRYCDGNLKESVRMLESLVQDGSDLSNSDYII